MTLTHCDLTILRLIHYDLIQRLEPVREMAWHLRHVATDAGGHAQDSATVDTIFANRHMPYVLDYLL